MPFQKEATGGHPCTWREGGRAGEGGGSQGCGTTYLYAGIQTSE